MQYSMAQRDADIKNIIDELQELRDAKGHDYGQDEDTLANLRLFGWTYVCARMGDKIQRIASFVKNGTLAVKDESIEDTLRDNINYALYALIMYHQEKASRKRVIPFTPEVQKRMDEMREAVEQG